MISIGPDELAILGALCGVVAAIAKVYELSLQKQIDAERAEKVRCQTERDELRASSEALLKSYQERDAEELKAWRSRSSIPNEAEKPEARP